MKPQDLKEGDVVQLHPQACKNLAFAGCFMTVTEPKSWGAQGYVQALGDSREKAGGQAYYRATFEEMEPTGGVAVWVAS